jgi:ethanolamine utilization microcompartment shell protein EutL
MTTELQQQIDRYQRTGSYSLNKPLKDELALIWKERTGTTLVIACGSCLGKALAYLATPPAPKIKFKPVIHFIGIKQ